MEESSLGFASSQLPHLVPFAGWFKNILSMFTSAIRVDEVRGAFEKFGPICDVHLPRDFNAGCELAV